jgi:DNA-binding transcriptional ArsR family regulator
LISRQVTAKKLMQGEALVQTVDLEYMRASAARASALLKAMGNPHRLLVLCQLAAGERSVGELERLVGLSQSALSQHLARLRRDNLVQTRRSAQTIFYSLAGGEASAVLATLYQLYCSGFEQTAAANPEASAEANRPVQMLPS